MRRDRERVRVGVRGSGACTGGTSLNLTKQGTQPWTREFVRLRNWQPLGMGSHLSFSPVFGLKCSVRGHG